MKTSKIAYQNGFSTNDVLYFSYHPNIILMILWKKFIWAKLRNLRRCTTFAWHYRKKYEELMCFLSQRLKWVFQMLANQISLQVF